MKTGLAFSILLHVVLLTWAVVKITTPREFKPSEVKTVSVEFSTLDELSRIRAGVKNPKKKPKAQKKPKKVKPKPKVRKAKKVKKVAVLPPKPKPKPKPKKVKPKKKVVKKVALKKKILPKKKRKRKKRKKKVSFTDDIAALLNKIPNAKPAPADNDLPPIKTTPARKVVPVRGRRDGRDARMTMNEIDAFRQQIGECWNVPVGGMGAENLRIRIRIQLKKDGTLANPPQIMNSASSAVLAAASDAALRAVWQCQPYDMPVKKYAVWRDMILNFDPREMFQ